MLSDGILCSVLTKLYRPKCVLQLKLTENNWPCAPYKLYCIVLRFIHNIISILQKKQQLMHLLQDYLKVYSDGKYYFSGNIQLLNKILTILFICFEERQSFSARNPKLNCLHINQEDTQTIFFLKFIYAGIKYKLLFHTTLIF